MKQDLKLYATDLANPDDIPWSSNYNMIEVNPDDIDKLNGIAKTRSFKNIAFDVNIEYDDINHRYLINMPDGMPGIIASEVYELLKSHNIGLRYHL